MKFIFYCSIEIQAKNTESTYLKKFRNKESEGLNFHKTKKRRLKDALNFIVI